MKINNFFQESWPQSAITHLALVAPDEDPTLSKASKTSHPSMTFPNTVCFPSSQLHGINVMKNYDPLVFGPALAIDKSPLARCFILKFSSANFMP